MLLGSRFLIRALAEQRLVGPACPLCLFVVVEVLVKICVLLRLLDCRFLLSLSHSEEFDHSFSSSLGDEEFRNTDLSLAISLSEGLVDLIQVHFFISIYAATSSGLLGIFSVLGFGLVLRLGEGGIDDSECQVHQEESSDKHHGDEVNENSFGIGLLVQGLDVRPAFQSRALEHHQHGVEDVIQIGHTKVRIFIHFTTESALRAGLSTAKELFFVHYASLDVNTPLFQTATEELDASNGEHQKEKEEHDDCLLHHGKGGQYRDHQHSQTFDSRDGTEGTQNTEGSQSAEVEAFVLFFCVFVYRSFFLSLDHGQVGGTNDNEIENTPKVCEIGSLVEYESHTDNFEDHFSGVEDQEDRLDHLHFFRGLILGVFKSQSH